MFKYFTTILLSVLCVFFLSVDSYSQTFNATVIDSYINVLKSDVRLNLHSIVKKDNKLIFTFENQYAVGGFEVDMNSDKVLSSFLVIKDKRKITSVAAGMWIGATFSVFEVQSGNLNKDSVKRKLESLVEILNKYIVPNKSSPTIFFSSVKAFVKYKDNSMAIGLMAK